MLEESLADSPVTAVSSGRVQAGREHAGAGLPRRRISRLVPHPRRRRHARRSNHRSGRVRRRPRPIGRRRRGAAGAGILPAVKASVDRDRRPGRFLLTGSANVMLLPRVSESLAGRMETHILWPLSQGELERCPESFLVHAFDGSQPSIVETDDDVVERIVRGGFPPAVARSPARRGAWLGSYVDAVLQREVRELGDGATTRVPTATPRSPRRTECHAVQRGRDLRSAGIPQTTVKRYLTLLEQVFLSRFGSRPGMRTSASGSSPLAEDSGLVRYRARLPISSAPRTRASLRFPALLGALLESFVGMELVKQASWFERSLRVHHFRTSAGREVDFVLEDSAGQVVAVEVKARATVDATDLVGLRFLAEELGERFAHGIVLYRGRSVVPFGDKLAAWPISSLWSSP